MANFDKIKKRKNTNCVKYDGAKRYFGAEIEHPHWVADMDFEVPKFLRKMVEKKAKFGIFGYEELSSEFYERIIFWQKLQNNIQLQKRNIIFSSSVVSSLVASIKAFSDEGDEVVVFSPVYYPFFSVVNDNKRVVLNQELVLNNGVYNIDFEKLKKSITPKTKIILFCSPHNPIGRIWTKNELKELIQIAKRHNLVIVSDEIHSDIVFDEFTTLASFEEIRDSLVVLNSPSKSFNLAGLATSYVFSYNIELLKAMKQNLALIQSNHLNSFSNIAINAYSYKGKLWLMEMLKYIQTNKIFVIEFLKFHKSKIKVVNSNSTYLMWLDFREFGLSQQELKQKLYDLKIGLNSGDSFGAGGDGFMRLNIATQNKNLIKLLEKLIKVF